MPGPLEGVRVLDFTWFQQGPYSTVMLADFGAEIIKVELTGSGERARYMVPGTQPNPYFVAHDRGKHSLTCNIQSPEGREIIQRFVPRVDVVVNNFRPGVMDRLGFGFDALRALNPRIVYAQASAWGLRGERAEQSGVDIVGQAMGGFMSVTGPDDGEPTAAGAAIADQVGAVHLAGGIAAALYKAQRTGEAEMVDVSLYGCQIALQAWEINTYSMEGQLPQRNRRGHPLLRGLYGAFKTKDGHVVISGAGLRFSEMLRALDREDLLEVYDSDEAWRADMENIVCMFETRLQEESTTYWLERFQSLDVMATPVQTYADVVADPQAIANGYIIDLPDTARDSIRVVGCPIQFSSGTGEQTPPPEVGQHTEQYLLEIGYDWEQITSLRERELI